MKKQILFIYPEMMVGGSTTSLVSLLNAIDYSNYDVDLILYKARGELLADIPEQVMVLSEAFLYSGNKTFANIKKTMILLLKGYLLKSLFYEWKYNRRLGLNNQVMAFGQAFISRRLEKEYDVGIGFLELWSNAYLTSNIKSKIKIGWIHVDYEKAHYIPKIDKDSFKQLDRIVCVSQSCLKSFNNVFPSLTIKSTFLENVISPDYVKRKAEADGGICFEGLKIITLCRLVMQTKGLDRAVETAYQLKQDGYIFRWYIVGEGQDRKKLEDMIELNGLQDTVILLGLKLNPYPYLKSCDLFVLPSRNEGKPVSVTEAQILGLPVITTDYASATEQVRNGVDGLVVDNNKGNSIYEGIKDILDHPELLIQFQNNLKERNFGNENTMMYFYDLLN